jgi:hypothetical protein
VHQQREAAEGHEEQHREPHREEADAPAEDEAGGRRLHVGSLAAAPYASKRPRRSSLPHPGHLSGCAKR